MHRLSITIYLFDTNTPTHTYTNTHTHTVTQIHTPTHTNTHIIKILIILICTDHCIMHALLVLRLSEYDDDTSDSRRQEDDEWDGNPRLSSLEHPPAEDDDKAGP